MISLPRDFLFGWSQSDFQFEMGLPGSEDPNSDWWVWVHDPENIAAGLVSGDLPEDGPGYWHRYRDFHDAAESMGLKIARVSVSWSRLFPRQPPPPRGWSGEVSEVKEVPLSENDVRALEAYVNRPALEHYREMFRDLKSRGITLIVNLYHWPLPLWLHDPIRVRKGDLTGPTGWLSARTVFEFARFAAFVASTLDDLVDGWSTMNEPNVIAWAGYGGVRSGFPPGYLDLRLVDRALYNLAQAHARAYDALRLFSRKPIGIIYANTSYVSLTEADEAAAEAAEASERWSFMDAVVRGDVSRWGPSTHRDDMKGRVDWIGVNYYTRTVVRRTGRGRGYEAVSGYGHLCERNGVSPAGRPCSDFGWEFWPEGIHDVLVKYWRRYQLPLYVTENGVADDGDYLRPYYVVSHVAQVARALSDGVDVRAYMHWSLTDNYEWASGFSMRFGLLKVDYRTKRLYWRPSALVYREIARSSGVPSHLEHLNSIPPLGPLHPGHR